ncbi:hypothetical protein MRB53_040852 [Persea americana]|nr:hypothetical protein MRB53_040852 [Persea americana]
MWLVNSWPYTRLNGGAHLPQDKKDRLFVTSLQSIEYALLLENEVRAVQWGWLFKTYFQWHALAFLLSELRTRTKGPLVSRAWKAVDTTVVEWGGDGHDTGRKNNLWRPLRKLLDAARAARQRDASPWEVQEVASPYTQATASSAPTPDDRGPDVPQTTTETSMSPVINNYWKTGKFTTSAPGEQANITLTPEQGATSQTEDQGFNFDALDVDAPFSPDKRR